MNKRDLQISRTETFQSSSRAVSVAAAEGFEAAVETSEPLHPEAVRGVDQSRVQSFA